MKLNVEEKAAKDDRRRKRGGTRKRDGDGNGNSDDEPLSNDNVDGGNIKRLIGQASRQSIRQCGILLKRIRKKTVTDGSSCWLQTKRQLDVRALKNEQIDT